MAVTLSFVVIAVGLELIIGIALALLLERPVRSMQFFRTVLLLPMMIDGFRGREVIYVMTFGGPGLSTELFSLHIYKAAFISQNLGLASALSILLLIIVTLLSLAVLSFANPMRRSEAR